MNTKFQRVARLVSMLIAAISVSAVSISCASHTGAIPPPARSGAAASGVAGLMNSGARKTQDLPPGESIPDSGCNYYANGDIRCAANCTGSWDVTPGSGTNTTTCTNSGSGGSSGSVGGPPPGGGGSTRVGNPFLNTGTNTIQGGSLSYSQRIYNALQTFKGNHSARNSTLKLGGASAGNECVTTVQAILALAGLATIGNNTMQVWVFEAALPNSGYVEVSQANASPGDFVINEPGQDHVGICETNGCSTIISNSSTPESYTWTTTPNGYAAYFGSPTLHFWHHSP